jgi:hypothetical protein
MVVEQAEMGVEATATVGAGVSAEAKETARAEESAEAPVLVLV